MGSNENANTGTTEIREGHEINRESLSAWMRDNIPDFEGISDVRQFKGGQSNPTYKLLAAERNYVLRRKPPGKLLKGAHAIEREAKVLTCLGGTGFPVPQVYGLCEDESIIGSPFYVMEMVDGRVIWDASIPDVTNAERAAMYDAMNEVIARLHCIDYTSIGLADYGRSGNFFARQIDRWSRQYRDDVDAGRDETLERVIEWLRENIPAADDMTSIVHGDFRIDNMKFHATEPRVVAVLDWELSTLGHPGADFAYHAMMYRMPPHIVAGLSETNIAELGIPTEEEYLASYCRRTGRNGMPAYEYYLAFNFFRLAAIFHGIKGRVIRGNASSAQARQRVQILPELVDLAWRQVVKAGRQA
ncbi:aminoglycoside phosphotransferase [Croceicoccus estronivorus]|nr:aminoglycoside phosphotransferase [Croceicoccus estronivorus]